jgi:hypothetical protein
MFGYRERWAHRENIMSDEGRDWSDISASQRMPEVASRSPETGEEAWNRISLKLCRRI